MYAPDVGEVVLARRTPVDRWVKAVVLDGRRNRAGHLRIKLQWLGNDDQAGYGKSGRPAAPIVRGELGWVVCREGAPLLIRQIDGGAPADG
jgi:hypothetical protein